MKNIDTIPVTSNGLLASERIAPELAATSNAIVTGVLTTSQIEPLKTPCPFTNWNVESTDKQIVLLGKTGVTTYGERRRSVIFGALNFKRFWEFSMLHENI